MQQRPFEFRIALTRVLKMIKFKLAEKLERRNKCSRDLAGSHDIVRCVVVALHESHVLHTVGSPQVETERSNY